MQGIAQVDRTEAMWEMYQSGKTLKEIGAAFGVTSERVRKLISKYPDYESVRRYNRASKCKECGEPKKNSATYCDECGAKPLSETCRSGCGETPRARSHYATAKCLQRYISNRPTVKQRWAEYGKQWRKEHPDEARATSLKAMRKYLAKPRMRQAQTDRHRERYQNDPEYRQRIRANQKAYRERKKQ